MQNSSKSFTGNGLVCLTYTLKREGVFNILINYCHIGSNDGLKHISKEEPTSPLAERCFFLFFSVITFLGKITLSAH